MVSGFGLLPLPRRRLIQLGMLGLAGGVSPRLALGATGNGSIRSCILLFLYGGPSHIETFDPKPNAPSDVRGEFQPIATSVPGVQLSEHLPRLAQRMHHIGLVRSVSHTATLHDAASIHALTGRPLDGPDRELFAPLPQVYPSYGSIVTSQRPRLPSDAEVRYAALPYVFQNVVPTPCQGGGFLGQNYDPLRIDVDLAAKQYQVETLKQATDLGSNRRKQRDQLRRSLDLNMEPVRGLASHYDRAYRLLDSTAIHQALDITQEPAEVRERYGWGSGATSDVGYGHEMRGQNLLLARRLVEAGIPFITVYDYKQQGQNWDAHAQCFQQHKNHLLPPIDRGVSALIDDLQDRGLLDSTLIVVTGEFGRTPKINGGAGRDHWPNCYSVMFAGGGIRGGSVYGASDTMGAYPVTDPVTPGDIAATILSRFGLDPAAEMHDQTGCPHRLATGTPLERMFAG